MIILVNTINMFNCNSNMKIVIIVRTIANYSNLTKDNFRNQINDPYKPKTELQIFILKAA